MVGQNRQTDEEHDVGSVEEGFQLARMKFDRVGEGDREVLGMGYCGINVLEGSELKLAWSKKNNLSFGNNFPVFSLFGNLKLLRCVISYIEYIS